MTGSCNMNIFLPAEGRRTRISSSATRPLSASAIRSPHRTSASRSSQRSRLRRRSLTGFNKAARLAPAAPPEVEPQLMPAPHPDMAVPTRPRISSVTSVAAGDAKAAPHECTLHHSQLEARRKTVRIQGILPRPRPRLRIGRHDADLGRQPNTSASPELARSRAGLRRLPRELPHADLPRGCLPPKPHPRVLHSTKRSDTSRKTNTAKWSSPASNSIPRPPGPRALRFPRKNWPSFTTRHTTNASSQIP